MSYVSPWAVAPAYLPLVGGTLAAEKGENPLIKMILPRIISEMSKGKRPMIRDKREIPPAIFPLIQGKSQMSRAFSKCPRSNVVCPRALGK